MRLKKYLTGGQVKLDKNKDGKITAEDFKLMKAKKKSMYAKGGMKMYAKDGAMVKALKKYANGGETDPPTMLKGATVVGKKAKPSMTKTFEWTGSSLNDAISDVNTFIKNKGNFGMQTGKEKALMKQAEKMLKMGAFRNLESLLERKVPAYRPGMFSRSSFKDYKEVAPSKVVDGKLKQISGEEAETVKRIRSKRPEAGMKPGRYTIRK